MTKQEGMAAQEIIFLAMGNLHREILTDRRFHFAQKRAYTTLRNAANYIAEQVNVTHMMSACAKCGNKHSGAVCWIVR